MPKVELNKRVGFLQTEAGRLEVALDAIQGQDYPGVGIFSFHFP